MADGGCLCGAVRYRFSGTPSSSATCHCRSCRRASGAPVVAWITVPRSEFTLLSGIPAVYESSPGVARQFCSHCGTALTYASERRADTIDITTASLEYPDDYPPTTEVWLEHRLTWQPTSPDTKWFEAFPSD
jgi:hypothetical protein